MNLALNPFGNGKKPEVVDVVKKELDQAVEECFRFYENINFRIRDVSYVAKILEKTKKLPVLGPSQIDILLHKILNQGNESFVQDILTGLFLTKMVQYSHDTGNEDFYLNTGDSMINYFAMGLEGKPRLKLVVDGTIGTKFAIESKNCDYVVTGMIDSGHCSRAVNCSFEYHYDMRFMLFPPCNAQKCVFRVKHEGLRNQIIDRNRNSEVYAL